MNTPQFKGTDDYLTDPALEAAVNCALALEKPLLVRGEPGTGKTLLADSIARSLDTQLIHWSIKSTTKADTGLYHYDAVSRLYDSRFKTVTFRISPSTSGWVRSVRLSLRKNAWCC